MEDSVVEKVKALLSDAEPSTLYQVSNYINTRLSGQTEVQDEPDTASEATVDAMPDELPAVDDQTTELAEIQDTTRP